MPPAVAPNASPVVLVAQYTVQKLIEMKAKAVTLSDSNGCIHDPEGIDAQKLQFVMDLKNVRRGRITREDALAMVRTHDGNFPWNYLGKSLEEILEPLDLTVDEFVRICDRFTNKKLFLTDAKGSLVKDRKGNLTKVNYDNPS